MSFSQKCVLAALLLCDIWHLALGQFEYDDFDVTLRNQLEVLFAAEPAVLTSAVRLSFHDCAGQKEFDTERETVSICDGCINAANGEHAGLHNVSIPALENIYYDNGWDVAGLSRADFWAISATIGIQYAQSLDEANPGDSLPDIPFYVGREDCSASPDASVSRGYALPYKHFPDALAGYDENLQWFEDNFGFNATEYVAILGAHTLGTMKPIFSGFGTEADGAVTGPIVASPWVEDSEVLNNDYYVVLQDDIDWFGAINDQGLFQWDRNPGLVMVNADIALWILIDSEITNTSTGEVSCFFRNCPRNTDTQDLVIQYANDNQLWLNHFAAVFDKMIQTGYDQLTVVEDSETTPGADTGAPDVLTTEGTMDDLHSTSIGESEAVDLYSTWGSQSYATDLDSNIAESTSPSSGEDGITKRAAFSSLAILGCFALSLVA